MFVISVLTNIKIIRYIYECLERAGGTIKEKKTDSDLTVGENY